MRRLLLAAMLPLPLVLLLLGSVASASVGHAKSPKPPQSGHWVLNNNEDEPGVLENSGGSFTVTKGHRDVKGLTLIIGPDAETACGTGTLRVLGKQAIHELKGVDIAGDNFKEWIVGKAVIGGDPPYEPVKVMLRRAGKTFKGGLTLNFAAPRGGTKKHPSIGTISYKGLKIYGGSCSVNFGFNKK
jgi:hypothetical protein